MTNAVGFGRVPVPSIVVAVPVYFATHDVVVVSELVVALVVVDAAFIVEATVLEVEVAFRVVVAVATQEEPLWVYPVRHPTRRRGQSSSQ